MPPTPLEQRRKAERVRQKKKKKVPQVITIPIRYTASSMTTYALNEVIVAILTLGWHQNFKPVKAREAASCPGSNRTGLCRAPQ